MLRDFNNDGFEYFLKQSADRFRMRPSAKVWKNISGKLDAQRRRLSLGLSAFLVGAFLLSYLSTNTYPPVKPVGGKLSIVHKAKPSFIATNPITAGSSSAPSIASGPLLRNNPERFTIVNNNSTALPEVNNGEQILNNLVDAPAAFHSEIPNPLIPQLLSLSSLPQEAANNPIAPYKIPVKQRKLSFQLVFNPTVSYRTLSENKSYGLMYNYNINSLVAQKPDMGLEFGFLGKYALSKRVKLTSGLQFNLNHYSIKAFQDAPQFTTIALSNGYRYDSISALSNYRNLNNDGNKWLKNFYFSVSVPVGVEVKLAGNSKTQFGIAGTVQPTYILSNRAYLLSANLKNYAEAPQLVRHWNMNTSFQPFVAYSTGHLKWQVGPQVRYQLLSSFTGRYPLKENLFDFGLKVGVSLNRK